MTQSGGNGKKETKADELTLYEPVFVAGSEEDEEAIGYLETDVKGDGERILQELPPELLPDVSDNGDETEQPNL